MAAYITKIQAMQFVEGVLGIKDFHAQFADDKIGCINNIVRSFLNKMIWQNIVHLSQARSVPGGLAGDIPSMSDNVDYVLSGVGGLCWTLNPVMYELLRAIGYDVTPGLATVITPQNVVGNHAIVFVNNLRDKGSIHMIDVGFGCPCFSAVDLDFDEESETVHESFQTYKYVKKGEVYYRYEWSKKDKDSNDQVLREWKASSWFEIKPFDLKDIASSILKTEYQSSDSFFNYEFHAVRFINDKAVALKNMTLLLENDEHVLVPTELESWEEFSQQVALYFSEIPTETVTKAYAAIQTLKTLS